MLSAVLNIILFLSFFLSFAQNAQMGFTVKTAFSLAESAREEEPCVTRRRDSALDVYRVFRARSASRVGLNDLHLPAKCNVYP